MDPLSSLSLAGTVVQFVQAAGSLIKSMQQVHRSASGASEETEWLDAAYGSLSTFNDELLQGSRAAFDTEIKSLAETCRSDCQQLMGIVESVKPRKGQKKRWWSSAHKAVREVWKHDDIVRIEQRVASVQRTIVFRICTLSSPIVNQTLHNVEALREQANSLSVKWASELSSIQKTVTMIHDRISAVKCSGVQVLSQQDINDLTSTVMFSSERTKAVAREYDILTSLDYEHRAARLSTIPVAHERTFRWIFNHPTTKRQTTVQKAQESFSRWLSQDSGIFWVTGKPGSGKSTLMKYIASHPQTRESLAKFAAPKTVALASHYFWSPGTTMQKCYEGLLRSILYGILSKTPELIARACPLRWVDEQQIRRQEWTVTELSGALSTVAGITDLPHYFCIFIDGLDEYSGDHQDLCESILALAQSDSFKICVASRPWNVFQENFEGSHHTVLAVHELTARDINNYTNDRLSQHPEWARFCLREQAASKLITEITDRADGVFLWVFLVIREMRNGLTNKDRLSDLWKRLEALPTDLERFFRHILMSVDSIYHNKMASTLLIAIACESPLEDIIYLLHEEEYDDEHYAINTPIESYYLETPPSSRINALSKGLLEIRARERQYANGESSEQMVVEFLHRTVRDFLRTREMTIFLEEKRERTFLTYRSIFKAYTALIKHTRFSGEIDQSAFMLGFDCGDAHSLAEDALVSALRYASLSIDEDESNTFELLDDLEWSFHIKATTGKLNFPDAEDKETLVERTALFFRQYLLFLDLPGYISRKLSFDSDYFSNVHNALLHVLSGITPRPPLFPRSCGQMITPKKARTIQILLSNGHCPNEAEQMHSGHSGDPRTTPWTVLLSGFGDFRIGQYFPSTRDTLFEDACEASFIACLDLGLFSLLLDHGADPNAHILAAGRALPAWVEFCIFSLRFPRLFEHEKRFLFDLDKFISLGAKPVVPSLEARAPGQGDLPEDFRKLAQLGTRRWHFCHAVLQRAAVVEPHIISWLGILPGDMSVVPKDEFFSGAEKTPGSDISPPFIVEKGLERGAWNKERPFKG